MQALSGACAEIEPAGCGRLVSGIRWLLFDLKVNANSGLGAEKKKKAALLQPNFLAPPPDPKKWSLCPPVWVSQNCCRPRHSGKPSPKSSCHGGHEAPVVTLSHASLQFRKADAIFVTPWLWLYHFNPPLCISPISDFPSCKGS